MHDPVHTHRPDPIAVEATRLAQGAAMRGRRDGLTEHECSQLYAITYATAVEELTYQASCVAL